MPQSLQETAFEASPVAQMVLAHRSIRTANRAAHVLFGYAEGEMVGQSIRLLYPTTGDFSDIGARAEAGLAAAGSYEDQRFMRQADGTICWMRARGVTLTPEVPFDLTVWAFELIADKPSRSIDLTDREQEIAREVVNGRTCKEIGLSLGISHRTVEVHRARLMKKLGARNTAELVSRFIVVG